MSDLRDAIGDYLRVRRSLGFALRDAQWLLADFAGYLEQQGAARVTAEHALAWATRPTGAHPHWWHQRLAVVRDFARYLHTIAPLTELPAPDLLPACYSRRTPTCIPTPTSPVSCVPPRPCPRHCEPPPTTPSSGCWR
jgi:integrase/recombinase XerD